MRPYFYSPPFTPTPPEVDSYQELCISMSILSLKDAVLELFGQDDCYLIGVDNLLLEASLNGKAIGKVDLVSHKTRPGVWETDQSLNLTKLATDFMVCVYTEVNDKERQLLGFMELNGPELQDTLGREKYP
ncbi:hypothetical protein CPB86DRAFT_595777 [Serendipita vermifera]|nr:hypothetical protein CPB86DRAFT_595777 [Serendipita vermifera]